MNFITDSAGYGISLNQIYTIFDKIINERTVLGQNNNVYHENLETMILVEIKRKEDVSIQKDCDNCSDISEAIMPVRMSELQETLEKYKNSNYSTDRGYYFPNISEEAGQRIKKANLILI